MKKILLLTAITLCLLTAATAAAARPGLGPRVGWTHDSGLDQFHFGGQAVFTEVLTNVRIMPNVELGLGDGWTILAINGDLVYDATELATGNWGFYAGGGLALNRFDHDFGDSTEFGLNLLLGTTYRMGLGGREAFLELRFGLEDSPDLKLTLGLTFF